MLIRSARSSHLFSIAALFMCPTLRSSRRPIHIIFLPLVPLTFSLAFARLPKRRLPSKLVDQRQLWLIDSDFSELVPPAVPGWPCDYGYPLPDGHRLRPSKRADDASCLSSCSIRSVPQLSWPFLGPICFQSLSFGITRSVIALRGNGREWGPKKAGLSVLTHSDLLCGVPERDVLCGVPEHVICTLGYTLVICVSAYSISHCHC